MFNTDFLVENFHCPKTKGRLIYDADSKSLVSEMEGATVAIYEEGVWNFLDPDQASRGEIGLAEIKTEPNAQQTLATFGNEWTHEARWGWLDEYPKEPGAHLEFAGGLARDTKRALNSKTRIKDAMFVDKIVLDAGCGNGRHARESSRLARLVICVDASDAIYVARDNLQKKDNVIFVKCSLLNLPINKEVVDVVYSIGVMQHTGDAPTMLAHLARVIKKDGFIGLNCYGVGHKVYELVDDFIRSRSVKWPRDKQWLFAARLAKISRVLLQIPLAGELIFKFLYLFINVQPSKCIMFDWYSPTLAEHYSIDYLNSLFETNGLKVCESNVNFQGPGFAEFRRWLNHGAFEVRLRKEAGE